MPRVVSSPSPTSACGVERRVAFEAGTLLSIHPPRAATGVPAFSGTYRPDPKATSGEEKLGDWGNITPVGGDRRAKDGLTADSKDLDVTRNKTFFFLLFFFFTIIIARNIQMAPDK
jgi:hypothetical protein